MSFSLSLSFSQLFPPSALPSALPLPPPRCCGVPKRYPRRSGRGIFLFFQKGEWPPSPFCIPPEGFSCPAGAMRKFWRAGARPAPFPRHLPPLPPSRCCGVPKRYLRRSGRGIFYFFKRGSGHRPPFASPRGTFLPGGAMRKFWRGGTLFFHFPCLGMQKAREQMLPGFCVTPDSRSSSSPSAGSCGRCAPPWGRCPGSTAPGRPCRR